MTKTAPDGDARISGDDVNLFDVPACIRCGGIVKPDVVFFGDSIPVSRSMRAQQYVQESSALLVIGSSLMVFSGYRFARLASDSGKPIAIVNRGTTRADEFATFKIAANCAELLPLAARRLAA